MTHSRRKKIGYYTINDPQDKRSWSGITYYLSQTLIKHIGDVHFLGPIKTPWLLDKLSRGVQKFARFFFKSEWIPKYSIFKNIYFARILSEKMKGQHYDFIVAPAAASELAYLNTDAPVIYFGDATYKIYSETYKKEFRNLSAFSRWEGNYLEMRSLNKSSLIILTSQWAANSAIADYGINAKHIEVMMLGANIDFIPSKDVIFNKENNSTLRLLFLAVDWERKGGKIAFETLQHLKLKGINTKLIICGCAPPPDFTDPDMEVIPFIDKNVPKAYNVFVTLLSSVNFLILPTRADCSLLVAMESNSYGVPAITVDVGGVRDVVKDGINGYCLPLYAGGTEFASLIEEIFLDKARYHLLIESSRLYFETNLNWDKWAIEFADVLNKHGL